MNTYLKTNKYIVNITILGIPLSIEVRSSSRSEAEYLALKYISIQTNVVNIEKVTSDNNNTDFLKDRFRIL